MAKVPKGFKLVLIDGQGTVRGTVEIDGYDLSKPLARTDMMLGIMQAIDNARPPMTFSEAMHGNNGSKKDE